MVGWDLGLIGLLGVLMWISSRVRKRLGLKTHLRLYVARMQILLRGDRNDNGWSYAESVKGDDIVNDSKKKEMVVKMEEMYWEGSKANSGWLEKCMVGVLRGFDEISSVNYRLTNRGFSFSSSYLGNKLVLWEFDSEEGCLDKIKVIKSRFSSTLTVEEDPLPVLIKQVEEKLGLQKEKATNGRQDYKGDTHQNFRGEGIDKGWSYVEVVKGDEVVKDSMKKEIMVKMEEMYWLFEVQENDEEFCGQIRREKDGGMARKMDIYQCKMGREAIPISQVKGKGKKEYVRLRPVTMYDPNAKLVLEKGKNTNLDRVSVETSSSSDSEKGMVL
ncbi:hypothetical protein LWI28_015800 [Acer negundo]|uniref:Uncharacterized protein n=1 Tax=Acer negundo TaxID=4023 RepID=A0AAD5IVN6_ACENE|nr:hypothetical protein LWI28_015800 [Acer negundo]